MSSPVDSRLEAALDYFKQLQNDLCADLSALEPAANFMDDVWRHKNGGGITRVMEGGELFEKGGVNFSHIRGAQLPAAASAEHPHLVGQPFAAAGVSVVMHPRNPYVPCCHMNVRFFTAADDAEGHCDDDPRWWFGGGYDLTPCYGFEDDCRHWHAIAKQTCDRFDAAHYPRFKAWCDDYFHLPHRGEQRGIGGLFFDDYRAGGFARAFEFVRSVGDSFIHAYRPIVWRRRAMPYTEQHRAFLGRRRGRYVEFNLVYDRGTLFGLQAGGRIESILMSMPPAAQWRYAGHEDAESASAQRHLATHYLKPRDWIKQS